MPPPPPPPIAPLIGAMAPLVCIGPEVICPLVIAFMPPIPLSPQLPVRFIPGIIMLPV